MSPPMTVTMPGMAFPEPPWMGLWRVAGGDSVSSLYQPQIDSFFIRKGGFGVRSPVDDGF